MIFRGVRKAFNGCGNVKGVKEIIYLSSRARAHESMDNQYQLSHDLDHIINTFVKV